MLHLHFLLVNRRNHVTICKEGKLCKFPTRTAHQLSSTLNTFTSKIA
jgi:hypothetical protein